MKDKFKVRLKNWAIRNQDHIGAAIIGCLLALLVNFCWLK